MVLCKMCGFEKDGVLCSEAASCSKEDQCVFESKEEDFIKVSLSPHPRPPFALFTVVVNVKDKKAPDTDEEIMALSDRLFDFQRGLENWVRENTPPEFTALVKE